MIATRRRYRVEAAALAYTDEPLDLPAPTDVIVEVTLIGLGSAPLGSEAIGVVVATGRDASEWQGVHVLVPPRLPCGECDACRRGLLIACPTVMHADGIVSHRRVPARFLLALTLERATPTALCLGDALALPYAALITAGLAAGEILVVDGSDARAELALRLGEMMGARVHRLHADSPPVGHGRRLLATDAKSAHHLLASAQPGDQLILLVDPSPPLALDHPVTRQLSVLSVGSVHPDLLPELLALSSRGEFAIDDLLVEVPASNVALWLAAPPVGKLGVVRLPPLSLLPLPLPLHD